MPEESTTPDLVELVRRAFEAANRRDLDAVVSGFAEDATFDGRALGDHFEGRAAIRSFIEGWFGTYEELAYGLEEVRDLGSGVVFGVVVQNGRPAGSAGRVRQREGWVFVGARGLVARLTILEVDEARAAGRTPRGGNDGRRDEFRETRVALRVASFGRPAKVDGRHLLPHISVTLRTHPRTPIDMPTAPV